MTPQTTQAPLESELEKFYRQVQDAGLQPLWKLHGLLTPEPTTRAVPWRWDADTLRALADRARHLVPIGGGGDRRVLACANPGLDGAPYATSTMWAAVQALGAGERAPAHRHTPAALRFVLEGQGVWTVVDGDPLHMSRGDLILTPNWTFHEHFNPGDQPMTWLDVLDLPLVAFLDAVFFQPGDDQPVTDDTPARSRSEHRYGAGPGLLPLSGHPAHRPAHSPLLAYRWQDTDRALTMALRGADHTRIRFTDPTSGADVMPTLRCEMLRVTAGASSPPRRQTGSQVLTVYTGHGHADIDGDRFPLAPGDMIAVPSWKQLTVHAEQALDVFCVSDAPVLSSLGLYRETEGTR